MRTRPAQLLLLCSLTAGACGDESSTPGGHNEEHDASGSAPELDASIDAVEGKTDTQRTDGGLSNRTSDAGVDANIAAGDASTADSATAADFCTGMVDVALCEDFEDAKALDNASWTEITPSTGASVSLADDGAKPGKSSFQSKLTGAAEESARLAYEVPVSTPSSVHAAFDYWPHLAAPADLKELVIWFKLQQRVGDAYPGLSLVTTSYGNALSVQQLVGGSEHYDEYPLPALPARWVRVELDATLGDAGTVTVRYDGAVVLSKTGIQTRSVGGQQTYVQLGIYSQQTPAATALYDNVVLDYTP